MSDTTTLPTSPDPFLDKAWGEIGRLGLTAHVAEIEAQGLTVIPPELACPDGLADRLLAACLDAAERRNAERPDIEMAARYAPQSSDRFKKVLGSGDGDSPIGDLMQSMLFEDPAFEEALMNPVLLGVATYLCGYSAIMYTMGCFLKGPNNTTLPLHADTPGPTPLPGYASECNATYVLTDFDRNNGGTAFVPGSHKWCRKPSGNETQVIDNPNAVAVEAKAGSLVCWHGNTWHGAFNRIATGIRVSIPCVIARPHLRTQEHLIDKVDQAMLDRNSSRFAVLMQQGIALGWSTQTEAISGAERATKFQAAYVEELGLDPAKYPNSLFA
jgi:ectoine hydroxylase-related dioxygenase (phytanoyl-CoA dioxygenase family)